MADIDELLRDLTAEEMTEGMRMTTKFVSKVFLEERHYQTMHRALSNKWDRLHSLSAAIKLMETYGVTLTPEEEGRLANLDEAQQISALVQKMPQQSNDQFQQFFLQLQLLVSTAMRVRRSLEEGRPDEVEAALLDADTTGIAKYMLRVAIVQAGTEVQTVKSQFQAWTDEADNKMGRLIRGQQDNLSAQKKLAHAEAELARQNGEQNAKAAKAVMNFAKGNDKAFVLICLQGWQATTKQLRLEATLKEEYADRLKDLEDNMAKWKQGQCASSQNLMLKKIQQEQMALLGIVYDTWRRDVDNEIFMRENGDKVKALEERLANSKASQKENAQKVMSGMATNSEKGLVDLVFKSWIQVRKDTIAQKNAQEARLAAESKLESFTKGKSEEAKFVVQNMAAASGTGLVHSCMTAWIQLCDEKRKEAEVAEAMHNSKSKMQSFQDRSKTSSGSVMNRAGQHMTTMTLLRCFQAWRMDSKMEHTMKDHHQKIDGKRQQLVGVQQMFRKFAEQLESGMGDKKDSSRIFDQKTREKRKLSKNNQNAVSLPEIKNKPASVAGSVPGSKAGSRPGSQGGSRPVSQRGGGGGAPAPAPAGSPGREAVPAPRAAWN